MKPVTERDKEVKVNVGNRKVEQLLERLDSIHAGFWVVSEWLRLVGFFKQIPLGVTDVRRAHNPALLFLLHHVTSRQGANRVVVRVSSANAFLIDPRSVRVLAY